jgi:hypothetical protein
MHVMGHRHPSAEFIELSFLFASHDGFHNPAGDPWILPPHRTGAIATQGAIRGPAGMSWRGVWAGWRMGRE